MAKVTAPFLSFDAAGTVGGTITAAKWKGRNYVRQRVTPANPRTAQQTLTRNCFAWASDVWKSAPSLLTAPWELYVKGLVQTARNAFQGYAVSSLREETDLANFIFSPGAKGGPPATAIGLTPGSGEIAVAITTPTPPTGWTLDAVVAAAIKDQDPQSGVDFTVIADEDATGPITLSGLDAGDLYYVGAWPRWTKPDGTFAYGPSISDSDTPTA